MSTERANYTAFVPNGDSRQETAIILVGTAEEHGIDQRSIQATRGGFNITEELADVLYDESTPDETPNEVPAKKASASKAAVSDESPDAAPAKTAKKKKKE